MCFVGVLVGSLVVVKHVGRRLQEGCLYLFSWKTSRLDSKREKGFRLPEILWISGFYIKGVQ